MIDVSGTGTSALLTASNTMPNGILLTQFADDGDSLAFEEMEIAGTAVGMNGDLITWDKATNISLSINLIPSSDDDINVGYIFEANRTGKGKRSRRDVITLSIRRPNGSTTTLYGGKLVKGNPDDTAQAAGRLASKKYSFVFEGMSKS